MTIRNIAEYCYLLNHRRYLRVPDNGTLVLDTYPALESTSEDTPFVVIMHGITGSSQEAYTRATVNAVTRPKSEGGPGFRAVVLNFRGCKFVVPHRSSKVSNSNLTFVMMQVMGHQ